MTFKTILSHFRGPIIVIAFVFFANILYIGGVLQSNPADSYSGLASFTHAGPALGQPTIDPNNAFTTQALGHEAARDILHGHLPWWNTDEQVGAPLAGEMQSAALFLPFNLLLIFSNGVLAFHILLQVLTGIATYYLLKKLRCMELVSITGAVLFALNGTFAWITNAAFNPIAFLPIILLGVEILFKTYRSRNSIGVLCISLGLAFSLYAGFPEVAYLNILLVIIWTIARIIQIRGERWRLFVIRVFISSIAGVLLAAPILIAFKDYLPYADVGVHTGLLKDYGLSLSSLPALVMPYIYGPIFGFSGYDHTGMLAAFWDNVGGYVSIVSLLFAVVAVVKRQKDRPLVLLLAFWSLLVVARIYNFPGLATVFNLVPGVSSVEFYRYAPASLECAVTVLAMFGLEEVIAGRATRRLTAIISVSAGIIIVLLAVIGLKEDHNLYLAPHHRVWLACSVVWAVATVVMFAATILYAKKFKNILLAGLLLVNALAFFVIPQFSAPRAVTIDLKPIEFLQDHLNGQRFYGLGTILPNYGSYYDIASINTNNLPIARSWSKYILTSLDPNTDTISGFTGRNQLTAEGITPQQAFLKNLQAYESTGVKYVVVNPASFSAQEVAATGLRLVFHDELYQIYQLPNTRPYYQIVHGSCIIHGEGLERADSDCSMPSTLLKRELYIPGWTALVNQKSIAVSKDGPLYQVIHLPEGKATISYTYLPPHEKLAVVVMGFSVVALLGLIVNDRYHFWRRLK
jgi:hypothetical protein